MESTGESFFEKGSDGVYCGNLRLDQAYQSRPGNPNRLAIGGFGHAMATLGPEIPYFNQECHLAFIRARCAKAAALGCERVFGYAELGSAKWISKSWRREVSTIRDSLFEGSSAENLADGLRSRMSTDGLPMHVIAIRGDKVVGFGALKLREMKICEDREHWLGSLYVPPEQRGRGIASGLIEEIVRRGRERGVTFLSLQTERLDGGLYSKIGWTSVEKVHYKGLEVLVMERFLRLGDR